MKKVVSLLTAVCMLLTMFTIGVSANTQATETVLVNENMETGAFVKSGITYKWRPFDQASLKGEFVSDDVLGTVYRTNKTSSSNYAYFCDVTIPVSDTPITNSKVHISFKTKMMFGADYADTASGTMNLMVDEYVEPGIGTTSLLRLHSNSQSADSQSVVHNDFNSKTDTGLRNNTWHQIDVVIDQGVDTKLYVDGVLKATKNNNSGNYNTAGGSSISSLHFLLYGEGDGIRNKQMCGYLDDVRVSVYGDNGFYATESHISGGYEYINFSAPIKTTAAELNGAKIRRVCSSAATEVECTIVNSTLIKFPTAGLNAGEEYELVLPDGVVLTDIFDRTYDGRLLFNVSNQATTDLYTNDGTTNSDLVYTGKYGNRVSVDSGVLKYDNGSAASEPWMKVLNIPATSYDLTYSYKMRIENLDKETEYFYTYGTSFDTKGTLNSTKWTVGIGVQGTTDGKGKLVYATDTDSYALGSTTISNTLAATDFDVTKWHTYKTVWHISGENKVAKADYYVYNSEGTLIGSVEGVVAPGNANYIIKNVGMYNNGVASRSATAYLDDIKISCSYTGNAVKKLRYTDGTDSDIVPDAVMPVGINGFSAELYVADTAVSATLAEGSNVAQSIDLTTNDNVVTGSLGTLNNGATYTLTINYGIGKTYTHTFTTPAGVCDITGLNFYKNEAVVEDMTGVTEGDSLILKTAYTNYNASAQSASLIIAAYSGDVFKTAVLKDVSLVFDTTGNATVESDAFIVPAGIDEIRGFIWDMTNDNIIPLYTSADLNAVD